MWSNKTEEKSVWIDTVTLPGVTALFWNSAPPMVLDLGTEDMAGCPMEQDLPDCDCDVNRQDRLENLC